MVDQPKLPIGEIFRNVATSFQYKPSEQELERWSRITTDGEARKAWAEMYASVRSDRKLRELEPDENSYPKTPEGYAEWQNDMRAYGKKQKDKYGVVLVLGLLGLLGAVSLGWGLIGGSLVLASIVAMAWGGVCYLNGEKAHRRPDEPRVFDFHGYDPEEGLPQMATVTSSAP